MRHPRIALGLLVLLGCYTPPTAIQVPAGHPADLEADPTPFRPEPNPFALTPTMAAPLAQATGSATPGMPMSGMHEAAGMSGADSGEAATQPAGNDSEQGAQYTCPMHPEVIQPAPGLCPKCGMKLHPMESHSHEKKDPGQ